MHLQNVEDLSPYYPVNGMCWAIMPACPKMQYSLQPLIAAHQHVFTVNVENPVYVEQPKVQSYN